MFSRSHTLPLLTRSLLCYHFHTHLTSHLLHKFFFPEEKPPSREGSWSRVRAAGVSCRLLSVWPPLPFSHTSPAQSASSLEPQIFIHKIGLAHFKTKGVLNVKSSDNTWKLLLFLQVIESEVTNCPPRITCRSSLKRGPYSSEDDFVIPPPAKLTRVEEPKRGVLVYVS